MMIDTCIYISVSGHCGQRIPLRFVLEVILASVPGFSFQYGQAKEKKKPYATPNCIPLYVIALMIEINQVFLPFLSCALAVCMLYLVLHMMYYQCLKVVTIGLLWSRPTVN